MSIDPPLTRPWTPPPPYTSIDPPPRYMSINPPLTCPSTPLTRPWTPPYMSIDPPPLTRPWTPLHVHRPPPLTRPSTPPPPTLHVYRDFLLISATFCSRYWTYINFIHTSHPAWHWCREKSLEVGDGGRRSRNSRSRNSRSRNSRSRNSRSRNSRSRNSRSRNSRSRNSEGRISNKLRATISAILIQNTIRYRCTFSF